MCIRNNTKNVYVKFKLDILKKNIMKASCREQQLLTHRKTGSYTYDIIKEED